MYNESIKNSFTLTFDSKATDRKTVDTGREYQLDVGSSSDINSQNYLTAVHQKQTRSGPAYKASNIAIFDHLDVLFCWNHWNSLSGGCYWCWIWEKYSSESM